MTRWVGLTKTLHPRFYCPAIGPVLTVDEVNRIYIAGDNRRNRYAVTLAPLLLAAPAIQIHAFAAMSAFALGLIQFAAPKGTPPHRALGWLWAALMTVVCVSTFFIHALKIWGIWSPIHLLAIFTLIMLPLAVWRARTHRVTGHKRAMIGLFFGALVIAGVFTLMPGRIMHDVVFTR